MGLTLYKPDIIELASIFHTYFNHVEIFIDDILILNSSQLDVYHPEYQAKTLLMRGQYQETMTDGGHEFQSEEEHTATEVRVPPLGEAIVDATIISWLKRPIPPFVCFKASPYPSGFAWRLPPRWRRSGRQVPEHRHSRSRY